MCIKGVNFIAVYTLMSISMLYMIHWDTKLAQDEGWKSGSCKVISDQIAFGT